MWICHAWLTWGLVCLWELGHWVLKVGELGFHYPKPFGESYLLSFKKLLHLTQDAHHLVLIHATLRHKSARVKKPSEHLVTIWWQAVIPKLQNTSSYGGDIGHLKRSQGTFPLNVSFVWKWKMAHMNYQGQMLWVMSWGLLWGMTWKLRPGFSSSSVCQHTTKSP